MDWKTKSIAVFSIVLLLTVIVGSVIVSGYSGVVLVSGTDSVSWDFYVTGGVNTDSPSLPVKASPSDANFAFDVVGGENLYPAKYDGPGPQDSGYDWGNITEFSRDPGSIDAILVRGSLNIGITNNLPVDIIVTNLTMEVTAGTGSLPFYHGYANMTFFNNTMLFVDRLDPWMDECDYYTGDSLPDYDGMGLTDASCMLKNTTGGLAGGWDGDSTVWGPNYDDWPWGPRGLLYPDMGGDAALTNHVAPFHLAAGANFTEYMGVQTYGNLTGWDGSTHTVTQSATFDGTVTMILYYRRVCSPNSLDVQNVEISEVGYPAWPLKVNVTVQNTGGSPIDFDIRVLTFKEMTPLPGQFNWTDSTWVDTGTQSVVGLGAGATSEYAVDWDQRADKPFGDFEARGIALKLTGTGSGGCDYYEELRITLFIKAPGDVNGDRVVDSTDLGGLGLSWAKAPPAPLYNRHADFNLDGIVDSTDLGGMGINWGISY